MGGFGSGRHRRRKFTVEECSILRAKDVATALQGQQASPKVAGESQEGGSEAPICTVRVLDSAQPLLRIERIIRHDAKFFEVGQRVSLVSARTNVGGMRWWLLCPSCGGKVGMIYLPPGGPRFECRQCHCLTYRSVQTHDHRDDHDGMMRLASFVRRLSRRGQTA